MYEKRDELLIRVILFLRLSIKLRRQPGCGKRDPKTAIHPRSFVPRSKLQETLILTDTKQINRRTAPAPSGTPAEPLQCPVSSKQPLQRTALQLYLVARAIITAGASCLRERVVDTDLPAYDDEDHLHRVWQQYLLRIAGA